MFHVAGFDTSIDDKNCDWQFLIICDHASNYIPPELAGLGLPQDQLVRHIAYDIGALNVASLIAEGLTAHWSRRNFRVFSSTPIAV